MRLTAVTPDTFAEYVTMLETAAGRHISAEALDDARELYVLDRTTAIVEDGEMVAGTAADHLELTVPGGRVVPGARTMLTAVLPTSRRRGYMRALMEWHMRDALDHDESVLVGTTPVPAIVGRFDYLATSRALSLEVRRRPGLLSPGACEGGGLRMLPAATRREVLPATFERHRRLRTGQISRRPEFWRMWFRDRPLYRTAPTERFAVAYDDPGGVTQGYLTYRLTHGELRAQPVSRLVVEDLITVTDDARRALWTYCLDFDQADTVVADHLPVDELLPWLLSDRSAVKVTGVRDFMVLRLLDVPAALSERRYAVHGSLVLEVDDPTLTANTGRFRLDGGPDHAAVTPVNAAPDLSLRVGTLGAAYLGDFSFTTLARARLVEARTGGAVALADRMFAARPAPWTVSDW
ncbi:GNAT family N-acetyltransferase [Streptomyces cinnabarinus]|uniref:GNAT family N-acetyltransferase n=1 Tax=Streptomyces cinnabarinus TaxID=67287 RepID=A0ABY7KP04_9ACTN|nr:GNAT family N-acetyltransferase [Streptomyces cinnabarinus]WAZ25310.1 GNAT family N-acetyltransferase [Streptomyces cinnabarinus]